MPQLVFSIKPDLVNALGPILARWFVRFSIGGIVAYFLFTTLSDFGYLAIARTPLIFAIVLIVLMLTVLSIKFHLIDLHATKYLFYDTHVAVEKKLLVTRRHSMPYKQISKITNNSSLWDRISRASDMTLRSARPDDVHDVQLKSVKNSEDVEARIYRLLKQAKE